MDKVEWFLFTRSPSGSPSPRLSPLPRPRLPLDSRPLGPSLVQPAVRPTAQRERTDPLSSCLTLLSTVVFSCHLEYRFPLLIMHPPSLTGSSKPPPSTCMLAGLCSDHLWSLPPPNLLLLHPSDLVSPITQQEMTAWQPRDHKNRPEISEMQFPDPGKENLNTFLAPPVSHGPDAGWRGPNRTPISDILPPLPFLPPPSVHRLTTTEMRRGSPSLPTGFSI